MYNLDRPIIFFDLESTGVDTETARIIEFGAIKYFPNGCQEKLHMYINPNCDITKEITDLTKISQDMVEGKPVFKTAASELYDWMFTDDESVEELCYFGGYNIDNYDLPLLINEFKRAGVEEFELLVSQTHTVDTYKLYQKYRSHKLGAAYLDVCGKEIINAHTAIADTEATIDLTKGLLTKLQVDAFTIVELEKFCMKEGAVDKAGKFKMVDGQICMGFSKHLGTPLQVLKDTNYGFLTWLATKANLPLDSMNVLKKFL